MSWGATSPTRPLPPATVPLLEHPARPCYAARTSRESGDLAPASSAARVGRAAQVGRATWAGGAAWAGRAVFGGVGR